MAASGFNRDGAGEGLFSLSMQYQLILFGGAIAFSLALLSPWPAIIGAAAELVYLGLHFGEGWLRRRQRKAAVEERMRAWATRAEEEERDLEPGYQARVAAVAKQVAELGALAGERGLDTTVLARPEHLGGLVTAFTRLCVLHQRLNRLIAAAPVGPISEEVARLERDLKHEADPSMRSSLTEAVQLGQRRLRQQASLDTRRRAVGVKLGTLESSLEYLRSLLLAGCTQTELAVEIAEVLAGANAPLAPLTTTGTFGPISLEAARVAAREDPTRATPASSRHAVLRLGDP